jgi:putative ABC transport system substrate-binding protein
MTVTIGRRELLVALGGAAAIALPLAARAQQPAGMRRIGVLTAFADNDAEAQANITAFRQSLEKVGWIEGRNLAIDYRWGDADPERKRNYVII